MREVALCDGQCLANPGDLAEWVYFPGSCSISFVVMTTDDRMVETSSVGYEGVAALANAVTDEAHRARMLATIGGGAMALPASDLRTRADQSPVLMRLVLKFMGDSIERARRVAACHAAHTLSARLARWLLTCQDRVDRPNIRLTQEGMGLMAGTLRSSISLTAGAFKDSGLISYSRGTVEILDRPRLESLACDCYRMEAGDRFGFAARAC